MLRKATTTLIALLAATGMTVQAQDYHPVFRPGDHKGPRTGAPNVVMVLGTPHLSTLPEAGITDRTLEPVLTRLAGWNPSAIATEDLSGLQCDSLRRNPSRYAETVKTYCWNPSAAGKALNMDVVAANNAAERLLGDWPDAPTAAQRRHLAAVFLAAGERGSALVQWLRLPATEQVAGDGLTQELAAYLQNYRARRNETGRIASALAARLGLERVWSVDDHSADLPDPTDPAEAEAANAAISKAWDNPATQQRIAESKMLEAGLAREDGLLAMYRAYNAPAQADLVFRSDFGAALEEPSPQRSGRGYVGYWETRNLRMVSNIREVLARHPGSRVLAIVGASHKAYYEAYLDEMHDVTLADTAHVLR